MDRYDFSDRFDTLINGYANKIPFGEDTPKVNLAFDEYEKSVFLTKAQEELVVSLYNGKNPYGESFEQTEELRRYLSNLITDVELEVDSNSTGKPLSTDGKHAFYTLPDGSGSEPAVWFITYESAEVDKGCKDSDGKPVITTIDVVPVRQDEYHKVRKNPFRGANNRRVLRADLADGVVELISKFDIQKYYVRYLRKPKPILLEDLPEGMDIEGMSEVSEEPVCELHEALHQKILDLAVQMALQSKGVGVKNEK